MTATGTGGSVVVLTSTERIRPETNPYLVQLGDALDGHVVQLPFSWRTALAGRYDVFHLHWPEVKLRAPSVGRAAVRSLLFLALLVRLRTTRRALVRTFHNAAPHEPLPRPQAALVRLCDRWTTLWIVLSERGPRPPTAAPAVHAPIGHSRAWFAGLDRREPVPGRLLHFGFIRPYKGVEQLLDGFARVDDAELTLRVVGRVQDPDRRAELDRRVTADPRVALVDDHVPDEQLVAEITEAELVVLPFRQLTNSSSVLVALSLDRPVLVPRLPVIEELAGEVGEGWVLCYDGELEPATLTDGLRRARRPRAAGPDLARRDWPAIAEAHVDAYVRAVRLARARPTRSGTGGRGRLTAAGKEG